MSVAALLLGRMDFDVESLVRELVVAEGAPFLAAFRYTDSGLRKRREWEQVWDMQRREDEMPGSASAWLTPSAAGQSSSNGQGSSSPTGPNAVRCCAAS